MRKTRFLMTLTCCLLAVAVYAWAQGRRAGLWEVTSTTTFQQSPIPGGIPGMGGPHTNQVCVTQAMVDKYNGPPPQQRGDCQISNFAKSADGFSANVACTGRTAMSGTVEAHYTGDGHGTTTMHLTGSMQGKPLEMTTVAESTFKGEDCGSVKPIAAMGN
jgi:hypothetical protein